MIFPALGGLAASVVAVHDGAGMGAGVVWRPGLVATAQHVARGRRATVEAPDGTRLPAFVVASDPKRDVALLSVPGLALAAATIGDARRLRVGEAVVALGHPIGRRDHATFGIVSARPTGDSLQADLALAPGNSGGPLANAHGEVVGLASMIVSPGIALATASHVVEELLRR